MAAAGVDVPLMVQVTVETTGRMLVGSEIGAALTALEAMRPDVIGLNCATGPAEMTEHLRYLSQHARTFLSCLPNAGLPSVVDGHTHYDLTPEALADAHERFVTEFGLNIVGGCCGTTPEHLRAVVDRIGDARARRAAPRARARAARRSTRTCRSTRTSSFLVVGERTNANGSRKFRDAMLDADWDTCVQMAREQVKEGAHVLDVCVDYVGRDGAVDMDEIAGRFATQAPLPLVFDSTEPPVLEAGLRALRRQGDPQLGEPRGRRGPGLAPATGSSRWHASTAPPSSASRSTRRARPAPPTGSSRSASASTTSPSSDYGLDPTDLIFDCLTFPLGVGPGRPRAATASRPSRRSAG